MNDDEFIAKMQRSILCDRLMLEPALPKHVESLHGELQDPRLYRWIESGAPTHERLRQLWDEGRRSQDGKEIVLTWIIRMRPSGAAVGTLGAFIGTIDASTADHAEATIGYVILHQHWGCGYATEAVLALINALAEVQITALRATVCTENQASIRVLEKAGFRRGGIVPDQRDTVEYRRA